MTALPVGPYRLEFVLAGFRTYAQTGIVLQVNTNPTVNATLALGDLSETIQVAAEAPLMGRAVPGSAWSSRTSGCRNCRSTAARRSTLST